MRKRRFFKFLLSITMLVAILGTGFNIENLQADYQKQKVSTGSVSNQMVIPGGMPIGIYMKADGVLVLGTDYIEASDGREYNPAKYVVKKGDYIVSINGEKVDSKKELIEKINHLEKEEVFLEMRRNDEIIDVKFDAVKTKNKDYKLGIWVRDSVQGLGTVTYITTDNRFGALGHGIHDSDIDTLLEIEEGRVYNTKILRIQKGKKGTPGGMEGAIVYHQNNILGSIMKNSDNGIFGTINDVAALTDNQQTVPVCTKNNIKTGEAVIRCCVNGKVEEYDIEIERISKFAREANKALVIKVVDKELLKITGGIVQGM